jgi:uncharacterized protein (DUF433 family)
MTDDELIARHIVPDPRCLGPGDVRLRDSGVHVWAIIGQLAASAWDAPTVAREYAIPLDEVEAARAYYRRNRDAIDSRLVANGEWPLPVEAAMPS